MSKIISITPNCRIPQSIKVGDTFMVTDGTLRGSVYVLSLLPIYTNIDTYTLYLLLTCVYSNDEYHPVGSIFNDPIIYTTINTKTTNSYGKNSMDLYPTIVDSQILIRVFSYGYSITHWTKVLFDKTSPNKINPSAYNKKVFLFKEC